MEHKIENLLKLFNREVTLSTLQDEVDFLNYHDFQEDDKYRLICAKANIEVIQWCLEHKVKNWRNLMKAIKREKPVEDQLDSLVVLCNLKRAPHEPILPFIEKKIEGFKSFPTLNLYNTMKNICDSTWPMQPLTVNKFINCISTQALLDCVKNDLSSPNIYCKFCKSNTHSTAKCRKKNTQNNA